MHIFMYVEFNSSITALIIFSVTILLYIRERDILTRLLKATRVAHYLSLIVAMVWLIYWLSNIKELIELGAILAFAFQLILYSSIARVIVLVIEQFNSQSKA